MTIDEALKGAETIRNNLSSHDVRLKDIKDAANAIEALTRIIYWYDANQQRLIKTVNKLIKREKALKQILTTYFKEGDAN